MIQNMKISLPLQFSEFWKTHLKDLRQYGIAVLIFCLGCLVSMLIFHFYQKQEIHRTRAEFNRMADLRLFLLKDQLSDTLNQIESIKSFFYSSPNISRSSFRSFVNQIFNQYSNYVVIGWLNEDFSNVPKTKIQGFEFINLRNSKGLPSYFFPLTFLEKFYLRQNFFIDSSDFFPFQKLLKISSNTTETIVSKKIIYFQKEEKKGFFLIKQVFFEKINVDGSIKKKRASGTIIGLSNFEDIFKKVRSRIKPVGINIGLYDISEGNRDLLFWNPSIALKDPIDLDSQKKETQAKWVRSLTFKYGDRIWKLEAAPTLEFIQLYQNPYWRLEIPIVGIFISGFLSSYFLILSTRRRLIEQEVLDRTNELANINRILQEEIHERQRMEEDFLTNQNYLEKRHEALEYLTKLTTIELHEAIHEVILRTAIVMQVNRVGVWFYEKQNQVQNLLCEGLYILSTNSFSEHLGFNSLHFPHYFEALSKHSHLILPSGKDSDLNKEMSSYLAVFRINSKLDIPIIFEGNLLGVLSCEETKGQRNWSLEDKHFGQTIADIISIMIEQTARRKAENALKESEERLRFITQRSIDGIISINHHEEIISWNYGAHQMFGYNEFEILGKPLRTILPHDHFILENALSTKPIELQALHKDGHYFSVEISQTRWESESVFFDTIIIRDVTERKEYERRLIRAMRDAKAANAAKSEFIATISHELRTPLNAIIGFNQCLVLGMDGSVNEAQEASLKKIEKSAFHLLNLINNVLDWSKIEAKKMELEISPQNIVELISSCVEEMQSIQQQKNLEIRSIMETPFVLVEMDRVRIRQVLLNLLSNAIKFTEKGWIEINLIDQPDQIQIQIKDTGIGLTPDEIKKIFQPFSQADSSITRKFGGTGLGLAISKNIIHLHGGTITVTSQKGEGSTFMIILPKKQKQLSISA